MGCPNHGFAVATRSSREYNGLSKYEMKMKSQLEGNIGIYPTFKITATDRDLSVGQELLHVSVY